MTGSVSEGLLVAPGRLVDMHVHFRDPALRQEDI